LIGKEVYTDLEIDWSTSITLKLNHLNAGIYNLIIESEDESSEVYKIIKLE